MVQVSRPAASISPSARRTLTRARPFPGGNPAAVSNSASPHCSRERRCRSVVRTRSTGSARPFLSHRRAFRFQHKPMRSPLAPVDFACLQMTHQKRNPERNVEINVEVGRWGGMRFLQVVEGIWLRGQDLNLRPLGYEPNELPDCSTPHNYLSVCRPRGQILVTHILRPPLVQ